MKSFLARFIYAFSGIRYVWYEKNLRAHIGFALFVVVMGFVFRLNRSEWLWVCLSIALVLFSEIVNTCIELIVDSISTKRTPRFKKIKDMAAGGVLIVCVFALIVGFAIFVPKILGGGA